MVFRCSVPGCPTIAKNGLHSFPSDKSLSTKWIVAIKALHLTELLNANKLVRSHRKVCKKHFKESDFLPNTEDKSRLVANTIPSLHLPEDNVNSTIDNSSKPLKRLQQPRQHQPKLSNANIGVSKQSNEEPTLQNNVSIETVILDSVDEAVTLPNTGVDVNYEKLPKKCERSGHHRKTTVGGYMF